MAIYRVMYYSTVTVGSGGRITIPQEMRDDLQLEDGDTLTARLESVRGRMEQAAREENDHLEWCERRVKALGGQLSYLNPLWYLGSFAIGAVAGAVGDKWSLGFVAETEHQAAHQPAPGIAVQHVSRQEQADGQQGE